MQANADLDALRKELATAHVAGGESSEALKKALAEIEELKVLFVSNAFHSLRHLACLPA